MTENDHNANGEQAPEEAPVESAPEETAAQSAPEEAAAQGAPEEAAAQGEPQEAAASERPDEEAAPVEPEETTAPDQPEEELSPKERRRRARSVHVGEGRPERPAEERAAERALARRQKAQRRRAYRARARERRGSEPPARQAPVVEAKAGGRAKVRQGVVVSDGADKTITVRIDIARQHRTYGKIVRTSATLHAHDEGNEAHLGDRVRIVESRPLSRTKRWRLVEVLERAR